MEVRYEESPYYFYQAHAHSDYYGPYVTLPISFTYANMRWVLSVLWYIVDYARFPICNSDCTSGAINLSKFIICYLSKFVWYTCIIAFSVSSATSIF